MSLSEEQFKALDALTPPESLDRIIRFLSDLGAQGNTPLGESGRSAQTFAASLAGEAHSFSARQTSGWVAVLMDRYQIKMGEIQEFALWFVQRQEILAETQEQVVIDRAPEQTLVRPPALGAYAVPTTYAGAAASTALALTPPSAPPSPAAAANSREADLPPRAAATRTNLRRLPVTPAALPAWETENAPPEQALDIPEDRPQRRQTGRGPKPVGGSPARARRIDRSPAPSAPETEQSAAELSEPETTPEEAPAGRKPFRLMPSMITRPAFVTNIGLAGMLAGLSLGQAGAGALPLAAAPAMTLAMPPAVMSPWNMGLMPGQFPFGGVPGMTAPTFAPTVTPMTPVAPAPPPSSVWLGMPPAPPMPLAVSPDTAPTTFSPDGLPIAPALPGQPMPLSMLVPGMAPELYSLPPAAPLPDGLPATLPDASALPGSSSATAALSAIPPLPATPSGLVGLPAGSAAQAVANRLQAPQTPQPGDLPDAPADGLPDDEVTAYSLSDAIPLTLAVPAAPPSPAPLNLTELVAGSAAQAVADRLFAPQTAQPSDLPSALALPGLSAAAAPLSGDKPLTLAMPPTAVTPTVLKTPPAPSSPVSMSLTGMAAGSAAQTVANRLLAAPAGSQIQQDRPETDGEPKKAGSLSPRALKIAGQGKSAAALASAASAPPAGLPIVTPEMGQITLMAPPLQVASAQAERGGVAASLDWQTLADGTQPLDAGGLGRLTQALPASASVLYPALPPGSLGKGAVNLPLSAPLVQSLLQKGYGNAGVGMATQAADKAVSQSGGKPPAAPLVAQLVPTRSPAGGGAGLLGHPAETQGGAGALAEAGKGQATRGGVMDFLGMPIRLAPSLGGRSDLTRETAVRNAGLGPVKPQQTLRPAQFAPLRNRLFPAFHSMTVEPDGAAWRKAAPTFGLRDSKATTLLSPDARVPAQTLTSPQPPSLPQRSSGSLPAGASPPGRLPGNLLSPSLLAAGKEHIAGKGYSGVPSSHAALGLHLPGGLGATGGGHTSFLNHLQLAGRHLGGLPAHGLPAPLTHGAGMTAHGPSLAPVSHPAFPSPGLAHSPASLGASAPGFPHSPISSAHLPVNFGASAPGPLHSPSRLGASLRSHSSAAPSVSAASFTPPTGSGARLSAGAGPQTGHFTPRPTAFSPGGSSSVSSFVRPAAGGGRAGSSPVPAFSVSHPGAVSHPGVAALNAPGTHRLSPRSSAPGSFSSSSFSPGTFSPGMGRKTATLALPGSHAPVSPTPVPLHLAAPALAAPAFAGHGPGISPVFLPASRLIAPRAGTGAAPGIASASLRPSRAAGFGPGLTGGLAGAVPMMRFATPRSPRRAGDAAPPMTIQRSETTTTASPARNESASKGAQSAAKAENGAAGSEVNALAGEVWSLLKRRLALEAERRGRW